MLPVLGFVGMTHLGLVSGVAAAEKGFPVVCFDLNPVHILSLSVGSLQVSEPRLDELILKNKKHLKFTSDPSALLACDVVYVAPDVPTDRSGVSDLGSLNTLLDLVFSAARKDAVIVILSQVPPGFTRGKQRPSRTLYYQVETLIFGNAIERALYPERYIVGCDDPVKQLSAPYATFLAAHRCPIFPMRFESAELAKISINLCLVASLSTANTLAELCEKIGAAWSEIMPALKLDKRIGHYAYLAPGLGISGGNLERDLATVCDLADKHGTDAGIVRAWMANSGYRKDWPWRMLKTLMLDNLPNARIAILGLAYKQNTHSTKNSPSLALLSHLQDRMVSIYDPVVTLTCGRNFVFANSALAAVQDADVVCVMTPWDEFKSLAPSDLAASMRGSLLIDPFSVFNEPAVQAAGLEHVTLGMPHKLPTAN